LKKVRIQLKWIPQAQFAGVFVAKAKGFFASEGIDAELISGGPGINVDSRVASGVADIGISSLDSLFFHQQMGFPIISIAQIFQRSSQGFVTFKTSGIDTPTKMRGKTIGSFGGSNQFQLKAFQNKFILTPNIKLVTQQSIDQFISHQIDVGSITVYNELQTIFEKGIRRKDLNIFLFSREGVGMIEDTIIARRKWVQNNRRLAVRIVRANLKEWRYSFSHPREALNIVMKFVPKGSTTRQHQRRMLRVVQRFIIPRGF
jgi:NitT/TauT family transport system substrate-binding protein